MHSHPKHKLVGVVTVIGETHRKLKPGWAGSWTPAQMGKVEDACLGSSLSQFFLPQGERANLRLVQPGFGIRQHLVGLGRISSRYQVAGLVDCHSIPGGLWGSVGVCREQRFSP